jgi:hypothetical protein
MNLRTKHFGEHTRPRVSQSAPSPTASSVVRQAPTTIKNHSNAVVILNQMVGESPELRRLTEAARINAAVA